MLLTLKDISDQLPQSRGGRVSPITITRWIVRGVLLRSGERLKLRAVRTPGRWLVEPENFRTFLDALTKDRTEHAKD
jgi:hypothetical protein